MKRRARAQAKREREAARALLDAEKNEAQKDPEDQPSEHQTQPDPRLRRRLQRSAKNVRQRSSPPKMTSASSDQSGTKPTEEKRGSSLGRWLGRSPRNSPQSPRISQLLEIPPIALPPPLERAPLPSLSLSDQETQDITQKQRRQLALLAVLVQMTLYSLGAYLSWDHLWQYHLSRTSWVVFHPIFLVALNFALAFWGAIAALWKELD